MTRPLPQLHEGRDGKRELYKLVNELRRGSPLPSASLVSTQVDLTVAALTSILLPTDAGWVTTGAWLVPDELTGVIGVSPFVNIGSGPTFDNIVLNTTIGIPVVGEIVTFSVAQALSITNQIYFQVSSGAVGPTKFTGTAYLQGFLR